MSSKKLVQDLRELTANTEKSGTCMMAFTGKGCCDFSRCAECVAYAANHLADRIEAEYEPKPELDTVEKVAKDMAHLLKACQEWNDTPAKYQVERYCERLEALGVTFDD